MEQVPFTTLAGLLAAPPIPSRKALALAQGAVVRALGQAIGGIGAEALGPKLAQVQDQPDGLCLPGTALRVAPRDLAALMVGAGGDLSVAIALALGGARHLGGKSVLRAVALGQELARRAPQASSNLIAALTGMALVGGGSGLLAAAEGAEDAGQLLALLDGDPAEAAGGLAIDLSDWGKVWWSEAAQAPATERQLWDEFHHATAEQLPREHIAPLFERLVTLDELDDSAKLLRLAEVSTLHRRAPSKVVFAPAADQDTPETTWVP